MVSGRWFGDVSVKCRHVWGQEQLCAPLLPSDIHLRRLLAHGQDGSYTVVGPTSMEASDEARWATVSAPMGQRRWRYTLMHQVAVARAGINSRSARSTKHVLEASLRFWCPLDWQERLDEGTANYQRH